MSEINSSKKSSGPPIKPGGNNAGRDHDFSELFQKAPVLIGLSSIEDGTYVEINQVFIEKTGYSRDEIVGRTSSDLGLIPEADRQKMMDSFRAENKIHSTEVVLTRKDGSAFTCLYSGEIIDLSGNTYLLSMAQDISERKRIKDQLILSENLFREAFKLGPAGMTITRTSDGSFLDVNESFLDMFGYTREEIIGRTSTDLNMWSLEERRKLIESQLDSGGLRSAELRAKTKTGKHITILFSSNPIEIEQEAHLLTIMVNISEKMKAEEELREKNQFIESIVNYSPDILYLYDLIEGKNVYSNRGIENVLGYTQKEIRALGNQVLPSLMHPDDFKRYREEVYPKYLGLPDKVPLKNRYRFLDKQGAWRWIEFVEFIYLRHNDSSPKQIFGVARDITDQLKSEAALQESEERLRLSTEMAQVAVWEYNFATNTMSRSKNHDRLYGLKWQSAWHMETFLNSTHPEDRERSYSIIQRSVAPGGPENYKMDFRVVYPDNSVHWLEVTGQVIERNEKGEGLIVRGCLIDVTDRKRAENEIKKLNAELEARVKERTQQLESKNRELRSYAYSVSHDLKSPVRTMDGFAGLLYESYGESMNDEARGYIQKIRKGAAQMNHLIEGLLEYSRLEQSTLVLDNIQMELFVREILAPYEPEIQTRQIRLSVQVGEYTVLADEKGLSLAFRNLFENALKFTQNIRDPEINIGLSENEGNWILHVRDNGIGFDMKYYHKIFEIFQRLQKEEEYPGTGIGLALVHKAMERMKGRVWAESKPGKGATFYLELPKR